MQIKLMFSALDRGCVKEMLYPQHFHNKF